MDSRRLPIVKIIDKFNRLLDLFFFMKVPSSEKESFIFRSILFFQPNEEFTKTWYYPAVNNKKTKNMFKRRSEN